MLIVLLACGAPTVANNTSLVFSEEDRDGDGIINGIDCDPDDAFIGAATNYFSDWDRDGWASWIGAFSSCEDLEGDGYMSTMIGEDCDDTQPEINPGELDECDDDIDSDCDGFDCLEDAEEK